ncbi:MAG: asparagine synthase (glutamine-hydrolyzing) [Nanoarchaeota archaeon]
MCGIFGFTWKENRLLKKGLAKIRHRGPDDFGTYSNKYVSLGHRRLSIIDLTKAGKQPMFNEDKTLAIIFNGEIYNYKNLKSGLKKNHKFKSETDTEVLLHLYEEEGVEMLKKLRGMFAFCIYDTKNKLLFFARDRAGEKPLYYYFDKKKLIFASEIKALLEYDKITKKVNINALHSYLTFRANTTEETMIKGIYKLPAGNYMTYNIKTNKLDIKSYWKFKIETKKTNEDAAVKELKYLLEDSVRTSMVSDVLYGAYLSGGIDSGIIVALMSRHSSKKIKTFSVGFKEKEYSELDEARFLASKLDTNHHELIIGREAIKNLPEIVYQSDEPMSDPTSIPIYLLSKYAKKYCTVILTGEGADELFAGYPQYKFMKIHDKFIKHIPNKLRKIIPKIVEKMPNVLLNAGFRFSSALGKKGIERFSKFLMTNNKSEQYLQQVSIFNEAEKKELLIDYNADFYKSYLKKYFYDFGKKGLINSCTELDFNEPLVEDLLMKLDKNSMAFSIEGRIPFLDYRIIELSAKLSDDLKLKGFKDKYILRRAFRRLIPKKTSKRKKKHFFVPIEEWCREDLADLRNKLLGKEYIEKQKIFNYNYIKKINSEFEESPLFYSRQLWSLIVFQIWYKEYIENEKIKI